MCILQGRCARNDDLHLTGRTSNVHPSHRQCAGSVQSSQCSIEAACVRRDHVPLPCTLLGTYCLTIWRHAAHQEPCRLATCLLRRWLKTQGVEISLRLLSLGLPRLVGFSPASQSEGSAARSRGMHGCNLHLSCIRPTPQVWRLEDSFRACDGLHPIRPRSRGTRANDLVAHSRLVRRLWRKKPSSLTSSPARHHLAVRKLSPCEFLGMYTPESANVPVRFS